MRRPIAIAGIGIAAGIAAFVGAASTHAQGRATPACGATLTASVKLSGDMTCGSTEALIVAASNVVVNLNGHAISTTNVAVEDQGHPGVVVENGAIVGADIAVELDAGSSNAKVANVVATVAGWGVQAGSDDHLVVSGSTFAGGNEYGIDVNEGTTVQLTGNTTVGFTNAGIRLRDVAGATVKANHALNNGTNGISLLTGTTGLATGNIANGNGADGIDADGGFTGAKLGLTLTKNRTSFNTAYGIETTPGGAADGGGNVVQANGNAAECFGVVCAAVSS